MRRVVLALAIVAALGVTACGSKSDSKKDSNSSTGSTAATVSLDAKEYEYIPKDATAKAGSTKIALNNTGTMEHDFTIDSLNLKITAPVGQSKDGTADLKAGKYDFYCSIPGHKESGMVGTLTVS